MYKVLIMALALATAYSNTAFGCIRDGYYLGGGFCNGPRIIATPGPQFQQYYYPQMDPGWFVAPQQYGVIYNCVDNATGIIVHPGACDGSE